jgi:hypothetical protein
VRHDSVGNIDCEVVARIACTSLGHEHEVPGSIVADRASTADAQIIKHPAAAIRSEAIFIEDSPNQVAEPIGRTCVAEAIVKMCSYHPELYDCSRAIGSVLGRSGAAVRRDSHTTDSRQFRALLRPIGHPGTSAVRAENAS